MSEVSFSLVDAVFFAVAATVVFSAGYAVLSRNIVRAVFSLLLTFLGVAGLYAMLSVDFAAIAQLLIYVGGILVLLLFAVMLTSRIARAATSNRPGSPVLVVFGWMLGAGLSILLLALAWRTPWAQATPEAFAPTTAAIGQRLLGEALLPFEWLGVLLLAVIVGAVVVARLPRGAEEER